MSEDASPEVSLRELTPKQASRALARLAGATASQIAAAEGISKQAVVKTLGAKRVRAALADLVDNATLEKKNAAGIVVRRKKLVKAALECLSDLLYARKALAHGGKVTWVPDYAIRFAAATRILEIYEPPPAIRAPRPAVPALEESIEVQERQTTRRVSRRRIADAQ